MKAHVLWQFLPRFHLQDVLRELPCLLNLFVYLAALCAEIAPLLVSDIYYLYIQLKLNQT
ncbi:hypothetical protein APT65_02850 [Klebsiella pneumoniae]|nr:hypothetical protein APT65_02850 [Klebsiella pneumoniae]